MTKIINLTSILSLVRIDVDVCYVVNTESVLRICIDRVIGMAREETSAFIEYGLEIWIQFARDRTSNL